MTKEEIVKKYFNTVYRLALSQTKSKTHADDVTQEVFLRFLKKERSFQSDEHLKAWFIRVTINQCHDSLRRRKHRTHASLDEMEDYQVSEPEIPFMLEETLQNLPEKYRAVIILHYLEGFSVQEIAKICRISVSATKMRLLRGRELLKGELEKEN